MRFVIILIVIICTRAMLPKDFIMRPAKLKQQLLFKMCSSDQVDSGSVYSADEVPYQHSGSTRLHFVAKAKFQARKKLISRLSKHPFTGVFNGSLYLLIRLSMQQTSNDGRISPIVELKFLRSEIESGNVQAAYQGQHSMHFFKHKLETSGGLSDLATFDAEGTPVTEPEFPYHYDLKAGVFPFRLFLRPNPELNHIEFTEMKAIRKHTKLYDLVAMENPQANKFIHVGSIFTTSDFVNSKYADTQLNFQYQSRQDDYALRPSWLDQ